MNIDKPLGESWQHCLLPETSTLKDAVACLDRSGLQISLVVDKNNLLIGTLTDGDIRRGLLRGIDLSGSVLDVVHRDALVVPPEWNRETVLQLMAANKIHQMPVVDAERKVCGLHIWDDLQQPSTLPNTMVIMAGGKGTRLRPHTENCPKPLLPVNGKPMLEHAIERAKSEGFRHFILSIHYLGHMVEEHFGDGIKRPSPSEIRNKVIARRSLVAAQPIKAGETFSEENITAKRPGTGLSPMRWDDVIGRKALRDFAFEEPIEI